MSRRRHRRYQGGGAGERYGNGVGDCNAAVVRGRPKRRKGRTWRGDKEDDGRVKTPPVLDPMRKGAGNTNCGYRLNVEELAQVLPRWKPAGQTDRRPVAVIYLYAPREPESRCIPRGTKYPLGTHR